MKRYLYRAVCALSVSWGLINPSVVLPLSAAESPPTPDAAAVEFFENQVRPILVENCYRCHSHQTTSIRGNLVLDSWGGLMKGGDRGGAVVAPGRPEESLLIKAIQYEDPDLQMPPKGKKLSEEEIQLLVRWVEMGAPWPGAAEQSSVFRQKFSEEDRAWWALQPLRTPEVPLVSNEKWSRNEIDRFILRKLESEGLDPAPEAGRLALMKRVYFNLIGLPPTAEEAAGFLNDSAPDAYEKMIDRLLEDPRYGERWARHWLDLVRYGESDGYRHDTYRPHAWRYRDYVIRSFNEDKPYDQFVREQLAGDELAPNDPDVLVATGFLRLWIYEYNQRDVRGQWAAILNDITDVTGDVFMGVGMSCARCHDHKFDPILQKDYYRLQAYFTPILPRDDIPLATSKEWTEHQKKLGKWEQMTAKLRAEIEEIEKPHRQAQGNTVYVKFPKEIQEMISREPAERSPLEHQLAELAYRQLLYEFERFQGRIKGAEKERWEKLRKELAEYDRYKPEPLSQALLVSDVGPFAPPTLIPRKKGEPERVEPGILSILNPEPARIAPAPAAPNSTGRRTALARWLTEPENPLSTRVVANRIWQYHFGRGLVGTPSDFGNLGEAPSHPELLDWLALRFVERGWSFKEMHRLILTSATYRQTALRPAPEMAGLKDPENRWYWRMNLRRLEAEQIRDAMLAVTGELDPKLGGPSVDPSQPRRTIYTQVFRNKSDPLLFAFDAPDAYTSVSKRNTTLTPPQALLLMNGSWALQRARALADRLEQGIFASEEQLVRHAFRLVLGREPNFQEQAGAVALLKGQMQRIAPGDAEVELLADMPAIGGNAALFDGEGPRIYLPDHPSIPDYDFTMEATVLLRSLDAKASLRTIAARWDGNQNQPGWALGVTGKESRHGPGNLILQLVGVPDEDGQGGYEVIPSGLRLELERPYYVAVLVRIADSSETGMTFYLKDLQSGKLQTARVPHRVTAHHRSYLPFSIGGRDGDVSHGWDGMIRQVRFSSQALRPDELLIEKNGVLPATFGYWKFDNADEFFKDRSPRGNDLRSNLLPGGAGMASARTAALADLCHVLLNSNEFIYVE